MTRCQRWNDRRDSYRPADDERFDTTAYEVALIDDDTTARAFVERHHYSASYPAARFRFGLFHRSGELVGVAVFSVPCHRNVITNWFPIDPREGVELGRFVLLDSVKKNGESWFIARCHEVLRFQGVRGIVSFSDPVPRTRADGDVIFGGHLGIIYQATNAIHKGRSKRQVLRLLPDGRVFSHRNKSKIVAGARGWRPAAAELVSAGAPECTATDEAGRRAWLSEALTAVTRPLSHPGSYRYLWALDKRLRKHVERDREPYPKARAAA